MNASKLLVATLCSAALSAQANLYVDASTPVGTNDGLSWATAFRTIDDALTASAAGDEIWVASGTYTPRARLDPADPRSARYLVRRNVRLIGGFSGNETSISQWPALPCTLSAEIGDVTKSSDNLHHLVIAENDAFGSSMRGFTFARANSIGAPTPNGGAVLAYNNSILQLRDCTFLSNVAENGGAVYINQVGGVALIRCAFLRNLATEDGGAVAAVGGGAELTIANCEFHGNSAGKRGGALIYFRTRPDFNGAFPSIVNSVFGKNSARGKGGAVFVRKGTQLQPNVTLPGSGAYFFQCTFYGNLSMVEGGAIYANANAAVPANCEVYNSILWGNRAPVGAQYGGGALASFCNIQGGYAGTGNINADPRFVAPNAGDYRLQQGSPSVDTASLANLTFDYWDLDNDGIYAEALPVDLDGTARLQGLGLDMGAYER